VRTARGLLGVIILVFILSVVMRGGQPPEPIPIPENLSGGISVEIVETYLYWALAATVYFSLIGAIYFIVWAEFEKEKMIHEALMERLKKDRVEAIEKLRQGDRGIRVNPGRKNEIVV
jgi:hypothetical protein